MIFKGWVTLFLDLFFPPRCAVCKKITPKIICQKCLLKIEYVKFSKTNSLCSVAEYSGVIKHAIWAFKFKKKRKLASVLGEIMADYFYNVSDLISASKIDLIIPVPLHPKRQQQRGFNQSELLGQVLADALGIPQSTDALVRSVNTKAQFKLKKEERKKNIQNAFRVVDSLQIKDKDILLIDDIITTGATLSECTRVLKESGAKRVEVLTLSRA
jgi:ComF family protein